MTHYVIISLIPKCKIGMGTLHIWQNCYIGSLAFGRHMPFPTIQDCYHICEQTNGFIAFYPPFKSPVWLPQKNLKSSWIFGDDSGLLQTQVVTPIATAVLDTVSSQTRLTHTQIHNT